MVARIVARSRLVSLRRNSVIFHLVAAAADEDAEQYFQLANLRRLFDIKKAEGSDLDERAAEITPNTIERRGAGIATGDVTFFRNGTTGATVIPAGTLVSAEDAAGLIRFRTTTAATITAGNDFVAGVTVVALEAGARGNVAADAINQLTSRPVGIIRVTNPLVFDNGSDRESDDEFRARLQSHVQSLSRGTLAAVRAFALNVQLPDGRRVLFAKVFEGVPPGCQFDVIIDDGTGSVEEVEDNFAAADDVLIAAAIGGETELFTAERPIRDELLPTPFELKINAVVQTRGVDYELNAPRGIVELAAPLAPADAVTARYRHYGGLVQATQRVIDGDPTAPIAFPGVRAAGVLARVLPASPVFQQLTASISVLPDFDVPTVIEQVTAAVVGYINRLDIGADVIVAELIERAMGVPGMFNFQISDLTGTFPATDQVILQTQVARIVSSDITIS